MCPVDEEVDPQKMEDDGEAMDKIPYRVARTPSELESIRRHFSASTSQVHVTALDEVVSVNSFFTVAVFVGITLTTSNLHVGSPNDAKHECIPGPSTFKRLIVYEVVAFSFFQFSSLVAHGLKLLMVFKNSKEASVDSATMNHKLLRLGILASAVGSGAGTVFLMLSLINYVQLRFGSLVCGDSWVLQAAVPLIVLVSTGVVIFISAVFYAFLH
ncbi:hypothetical protein SELMODRAFT_412184 [Selaginella moellendorffii]|uniref:PGG domain-containing protein n=2 Tax=Selaginella moellendorffii TaxID=88036 RepID=D8RKC0_SELML|nr:uncharacterized protein LOC9640191 [Selaginella moellendorffii]EFJ27213.1 hypothetical protein SELMODRAFT_412184 [Selaginella moellendorffii]|eukprot:XP_002971464.1 uncharacterized protein LOC9640191 [Selaginella moellendorffii]